MYKVDLARTMVLVNLSLSKWGNYRTDKKITRDLQTTHQTTGVKDRFIKQLLPPHTLKKINSTHQTIRIEFYDKTVPWFSTNLRLLPTEDIFDFRESMAEKIVKFTQAVNEVAEDWDKYISLARTARGATFNINDYPTAEGFKAANTVHLQFMPVPESESFKIDLPEDLVEEFKQQHNQEVNALREGITNLHKQYLRDRLEHILNLSRKKSKLGKGTGGSLRKEIAKARKYNLTLDSTVENLIHEAEQLLPFIENPTVTNKLYLTRKLPTLLEM